jgi:hypothetical protein
MEQEKHNTRLNISKHSNSRLVFQLPSHHHSHWLYSPLPSCSQAHRRQPRQCQQMAMSSKRRTMCFITTVLLCENNPRIMPLNPIISLNRAGICSEHKRTPKDITQVNHKKRNTIVSVSDCPPVSYYASLHDHSHDARTTHHGARINRAKD